MTNPAIPLWAAPDFLGLIVKAPTGIVYTNRTGGTACAQRSQEGFLVPLYEIVPIYDGLNPLLDLRNGTASVDYQAARQMIDDLGLARALLLDMAEPISESWVHVTVVSAMASHNGALLEPLVGARAILTYTNSD